MTRGRKALFLFLPALALLVGAELIMRILGYRYDTITGQERWRWTDSADKVAQPIDQDEAFWWKRFYANPIYERDPVLFWRLKPFAKSDLNTESRDAQTINGQGFRDDKFEKRKAAGELRIIALGDSCTFGDGVANWETYANVLEDLLRRAAPARPAQVINAGVPGYTSYQIRAYLTRELLDYQPDLVLVYVGLNDHIPAVDRLTDAERGRVDAFTFTAQRFLDHFRIYQFLKSRVKKNLGAARREPPPAPLDKAALEEQEGHVFRVPGKQYMDNLIAIKKLGDAQGFQTIVMTLPHQFTDESEINPLVRKAASEGGIPLLDLFKTMRRHQAQGESLYGADGGHPNALGHRRIAEALYGKLVELGMAPPEMPQLPPLETAPAGQGN